LTDTVAATVTNAANVVDVHCNCIFKTFIFKSQSGNPAVDTVGAPEALKSEITTFADEDAGWKTEIKSAYDATMSIGDNNDSDLGSFLQRPIRAATYQWAIGTPLFEQFNPWTTFLTNKYVKDKISNYELLRMKLHVKVVISGTPFHYGRAMVSYNPLNGYDQVTVTRNFLDIDLIQASQRPHFYLNPAMNTGGEMDIPFFFRENYMSLSKNDAADMGEITLKSFGNLSHTDTGNPVGITVYLWATDVVLTMPTSLTSQSGKAINGGKDEYGQGIISKPAQAVAKAAGALENLPIIGPYARATNMVAGSVANLAANFGYSRPSVITDQILNKPMACGNLANVDCADAVQKLTLDSKAEVTIDPRVTGLGGEDEMSLKSIAMKESYLTTFTWAASDAPDDMLFNSYVTPTLHATQGLEVHMTPMCLIAQYFQHWQGSLKFRFQVVKSQYHKGRLLIRYDPRSHEAAVDYNTCYSRVIDIAEADDFEIIVGWGQNVPWLDCRNVTLAEPFSDSIRLTVDSLNQHNGVLEVNVLNDLVSPSAGADITVNVFVSACDDMKWAGQQFDSVNELHLFSQSGTENEVDDPLGAQTLDIIGSKTPVVDETMNVFFGDSPTSLRELFKRYSCVRTWFSPGHATSHRIAKLSNKDLPFHSGYDVQGPDTDSVAAACTISNTHPISLFSPCYAGYRGGMRRKYLFNGNNRSCPVVTRMGYTPLGVTGVISTTDAASLSTEFLSKNSTAESMNGSAATALMVNSGIEVELPFYNAGRIGYSRIIGAQDLNCNSHVVQTVQLPNQDIYYQEWVAAAEDFSLYFFTGVPIMYIYDITI
jgi:hypothetical protein